MANANKVKTGDKGTIVLVVSGKGGVGKSTWTKTNVAVLRSRGVKVAVFDADGEVGSTYIELGERDADGVLLEVQNPVTGCGQLDLRHPKERAKMFEVFKCGAPVIFVDLPGGSLGDLGRVYSGNTEDTKGGLLRLLDAWERNGYAVTFVHLISPAIGAMVSVETIFGLVGDRCNHVAVVNRINRVSGDDAEDFPFWYGHTDHTGKVFPPDARTALLASGGVEIDFPDMHRGTMARLEAARIPVTKAGKDERFNLLEQDRCLAFCQDAAKELRKAADHLNLKGAGFA